MWQEITIFSDNESQLYALSDAFEEAGALAITLTDAGDSPIFEPKLNTTPVWPENKLSILFDKTADLAAIMLHVHQSCQFSFEYSVHEFRDEDWQSRFRQQFQPTCFANRLWVYPSWCECPTDSIASMILDPGIAFGTGTHPTTRMCLQWLAEHDLTEKTILDFGCGSGILAIAAIKLGAKKAYAIDIDPQAIEATLRNANHNGISTDQIIVSLPEALPSNLETDIVIANILANPLIILADNITGTLRTGGDCVMSGVLREQADDVRAAYENKCQNILLAFEEEWVCFHGVKNSKSI